MPMAASAANAIASPARCMRKLRYGRIQTIFQSGLHEFLTEFIDRSIVARQRDLATSIST